MTDDSLAARTHLRTDLNRLTVTAVIILLLLAGLAVVGAVLAVLAPDVRAAGTVGWIWLIQGAVGVVLFLFLLVGLYRLRSSASAGDVPAAAWGPAVSACAAAPAVALVLLIGGIFFVVFRNIGGEADLDIAACGTLPLAPLLIWRVPAAIGRALGGLRATATPAGS